MRDHVVRPVLGGHRFLYRSDYILKLTPRPHQERDADQMCLQILKGASAVIDASDTGTGKTVTALLVARKLGVPAAVVCPKIVLSSWRRTAEMVGVPLVFVETYEKVRGCRGPWSLISKPKTRKGEDPTKRQLKNRLISWPGLTSLDPIPLLIFDEADKCNGRDTLHCKLLEGATRDGITTLLATATPGGDALQLKALGYALGLHSVKGKPGFWEWAKLHGVRRTWHGGWECPDELKAEMMLLIHRDIGKKMVRTKVTEVEGFQESIITADAYDIDAAQINKIYEAVDTVEDPLQRRHDIAQATEYVKVPFFRDAALRSIEEGKSPIVFMNYRGPLLELYEQLHQEIPGGCGIIAGQQKQEHRDIYIDRFQNDILRGMVCQVRAGGAGVSLHDTRGLFPRETFISPNYSARDLIQLLGRAARVGGISRPVQHIVFASGTPEEKACERVRAGVQNIRSLTDGDLTAGLNIQEAQ